MNQDASQNWREQMEVRVVALLLGEASPFEADELQQAMQKDPALAAFHDQMRKTLGLVQEASKQHITPAQPEVEQPKLSPERREALLTRFKQVEPAVVALPQPAQPAQTKPKPIFWPILLKYAALFILMAALTGLLLPALSKNKARTQMASKQNDEHTHALVLPQAIDKGEQAVFYSINATEAKMSKRKAEDNELLAKASGTTIAMPKSDLADLQARDGTAVADNKFAFARQKPDVRYDIKAGSGTLTVGGIAMATNSVFNLPAKTAIRKEGVGKLMVDNSSWYERANKMTAKSKNSSTQHENKTAWDFGSTVAEVEKDVSAPQGQNYGLSTDTDSLRIHNLFVGQPDKTANHYANADTPTATAPPAQFGAYYADVNRSISGAVSGNIVSDPEGQVKSGVISLPQGTAKVDESRMLAESTTVALGDNVAVVTTPLPAEPAAPMPTAAPATPALQVITKSGRTGGMRGGSGTELAFFDAKDSDGSTRERQVVAEGLEKPAVLEPLPIQLPNPTQKGIPQDMPISTGDPVSVTAGAMVVTSERLGREVQVEQKKLSEDRAKDVSLGVRVNTRKRASSMEAESLKLGMVSRTEEKYDPEGQVVKTQQHLAEVDSLERVKESAKTNVDKDQKEMGIVALRGITTYSGGTVIDLNGGTTVASPGKAGETDQAGVVAGKLSKAKAAPAKKAQVNDELRKELSPVAKVPAVPPAVPQPEISTRENCFSTFSLNVSDVSFKLAAASLESGVMPDPGSVRVEEFFNAFNYRDPAPQAGARLAFSWERSRYPFAHNRDMVRFSVQTAVRGREPQKPLNLVLMLDNSGSMERADRTQIIHEALKVLAQQLRTDDRISVVTFARTARLWVDGMSGGKPDEFIAKVGDLNPEGGTNLEDAMDLAYKTASRHFQVNGMNRVILLTDGAANLGNVEPEALKQKVINQRQKGIALDCFGIGWEGYNDDLLEVLSRNGDGRYGFLDQPEQAGPEFAHQLAGALNVAAADVKTQVEFNPNRVTVFRQIGYAKHQLTKEQFRDNTVDAAELAAAESGNALYAIEVNPQGNGPIGVVRVRYKVPSTGAYQEQEWTIPYQPAVPSLEQSSPAMRLAVSAAAFGEWLTRSPYASEVTLSPLLSYLGGVPETFAPDARPQRLIGMIRQAQAINGK